MRAEITTLKLGIHRYPLEVIKSTAFRGRRNKVNISQRGDNFRPPHTPQCNELSVHECGNSRSPNANSWRMFRWEQCARRNGSIASLPTGSAHHLRSFTIPWRKGEKLARSCTRYRGRRSSFRFLEVSDPGPKMLRPEKISFSEQQHTEVVANVGKCHVGNTYTFKNN